MDLLITLLDDRDTLVRRNAAEALGKIGDLKSKPFLLGKLEDPELSVREAAARSLGWLSGLDSEIVPTFNAPEPPSCRDPWGGSETF